MSPRTLVLLTGAVALGAAMSGCSSPASSTSGQTAGAAVAAGETTPAAAAASSPSAAATPSASATSPTGVTSAKGGCRTIDQAAAAALLGFTTKPGLSSAGGTTNPSFLKLDGCVYQNVTAGSLGYTVIRVDAQTGKAMVGAATARMAGAGSGVAPFTSGIPDSVAFTMHLPKGVDSQITAMAGDTLLSVASTRLDGDTAKSQASAIAAMQALIAAG